jgi:membrane-associated protein
MDLILQFIDIFIHLDRYISDILRIFGPWTYLIVFLIIFCETGLVVTPILPGDSLLFGLGAFAARGDLDPVLLFSLLSVAAERHGGKTIIIARFIPIIRTFAPFVAGIGTMTYRRFISYNVIGGVAWIATFVLGGYYFGNLSFVKRNFTLVIMAIIILSVMPGVIEYVRQRRQSA